MKKNLNLLLISTILLPFINSCNCNSQKISNYKTAPTDQDIINFFKQKDSQIVSRTDSIQKYYDTIIHNHAYVHVASKIKRLKEISDRTISLLDSTMAGLVIETRGVDSLLNGYNKGSKEISHTYFFEHGHASKVSKQMLSYFSYLKEVGVNDKNFDYEINDEISKQKDSVFNQMNFNNGCYGAILFLNLCKNQVIRSEYAVMEYFILLNNPLPK